MKEKILVTGAGGQLGTELTFRLAEMYGSKHVFATDISKAAEKNFCFCNFQILDVMDKESLELLIRQEKITQVYHLAAILSANGESNPMFTWKLNMTSLLTILELSRVYHYRIFWPSSIAVFGIGSEKINTPQNPSMIPETVYGISKQSGEQWCHYYNLKYDIDVRSIRYPGLIGHKSMPGGGTTDYAVAIFHEVLKNGAYECFLSENTRLPMMYMDDAVTATIQLMSANPENISVRTSYNISAFSFTPKELADTVKEIYGPFKMTYEPDHRQTIADSWSQSIDDTEARDDWGWKPSYDLNLMVETMLESLNNFIAQH